MKIETTRKLKLSEDETRTLSDKLHVVLLRQQDICDNPEFAHDSQYNLDKGKQDFLAHISDLLSTAFKLGISKGEQSK